MSNLSLTRKAGDAVRLELKPGLFVLLEVLMLSYRDGACIRLSSGGVEATQILRVQHDLEVVPGVVVTFVSLKFGVARLTFEAPPSVKIVRTELLARAPA